MSNVILESAQSLLDWLVNPLNNVCASLHIIFEHMVGSS